MNSAILELFHVSEFFPKTA